MQISQIFGSQQQELAAVFDHFLFLHKLQGF